MVARRNEKTITGDIQLMNTWAAMEAIKNKVEKCHQMVTSIHILMSRSYSL